MKIIIEVGDKVKIAKTADNFYKVETVCNDSFSCKINDNLMFFPFTDIVEFHEETNLESEIKGFSGASAND